VALPPPPHTARENVVDDVHGTKVVDPYRWLESAQAERVREWTDEQNRRTRAVLDPLPQRAAFAHRLRELLSVGLLSTPRPIAGRIFHTRREGDQKQAVLYVRDSVGAEDRALIDPNTLDREGLVTLDWYYPSPDARYVAYGLSRGGDEMSTLHVVDTATAEKHRVIRAAGVESESQLPFAGLQGVDGHLQLLADRDEKRRRCHAGLGRLLEMRRVLEENGSVVELLSGAATRTSEIAAQLSCAA